MVDSGANLTDSRSAEIIIVSCVSTGIAAATVALKIFARARIDASKIGWDDFFIFLSLIFSIVSAFFASYSAHLGLGRRTAAVLAEPNGQELAAEIGFYQMVGYPFNIGSFSFPNISIAILVNNLLDPKLWRTRALFILVILQVVFAFLSVLILLLMCTPVQYLWNKSLGGTCWSPTVMNDVSYWLSAYTAITDIVLAVIPIAAFWKLQMKIPTKLGVCIMMGLTFLSAIFTIIKATYLWLLFGAEDTFYDLTTLVIWGLLEQNVVIIAACIPTLRPFFHKAFKGNRTSQDNTPSTSSTPAIASYLRKRSTKRSVSISELPLDNMRTGYAESSGSRDGEYHDGDSHKENLRRSDGILRTVDVSMEWTLSREQKEAQRDDRFVPLPLREPYKQT